MSDESTATESTEEVTETPNEDTTGATDQGSGESSDTPTEATDVDVDALRTEIASLRKESAKYRTRAKEAREALDAAKTPEEFDAVSSRMAELETELSKERLARKYNLPDALASRISGDDDEARDADAKALAELFRKPAGVGSGGLDPAKQSLPTDPRELARLVPRNAR